MLRKASLFSNKEKREEIGLSPITKAPRATAKHKSNMTTQKATKNFDYTTIVEIIKSPFLDCKVMYLNITVTGTLQPYIHTRTGQRKRPEVIHKEIKDKVMDSLLNKVSSILRVPGAWLSSLIVKFKPVNITELFGLFLASNLIPDV